MGKRREGVGKLYSILLASGALDLAKMGTMDFVVFLYVFAAYVGITAAMGASKTAAPTHSLVASVDILAFFQAIPRWHLTEGTHQKWFYGSSALECAKRCVFSAREEPERFSCQSFEFFPYEDLRQDAPWREMPTSGVCVLNSANSVSARLRYEDEGLTDAELIYTSHFTERLESMHYAAVYYGIGLNPVIYDVEDETGPSSLERVPWPLSRLGAVVLSRPTIDRRHFFCAKGNDAATVSAKIVQWSQTSSRTFIRAIFAPLDVNTGTCATAPVSREEAVRICASAGATLCTLRELRMGFGEILGCGVDAKDMTSNVLPFWAQDETLSIDDSKALKHTKCCASYRQPMTCSSYEEENIEFCSQLRTEKECVRNGTGFERQAELGWGRLLQEMRRNCLRDEFSCTGVSSYEGWAPRDKCIWCGSDCRPGSDFGVCGYPTWSQTKEFVRNFNVDCSPELACNLARAYSNLEPFLTLPFTTAEDTLPPSPRPTIVCQTLRTPRDCARFYDDCYWGVWYGTPVCRPLETLSRGPTRKPTKRPTKKTKKKKKSG